MKSELWCKKKWSESLVYYMHLKTAMGNFAFSSGGEKKHCPRVLLALIIMTLVVLLVSCTPKAPEENIQEEKKPVVNSVAVLPVDISIVPDGDSPYPPSAARLEPGAETLDRIISEYFGDSDRITIITKNRKESLIGNEIGNRHALARSVGRQVDADAVLMCSIYRYIERAGKKHAVVHPASVGFRYSLVLTKTGETICSGVFDETQQAVFENMFSLPLAIKRGFQWITAEELAKEGVKSKFDDCKYLNPRGQ